MERSTTTTDEKQAARVIDTPPASRAEPTLEGFEQRFSNL